MITLEAQNAERSIALALRLHKGTLCCVDR